MDSLALVFSGQGAQYPGMGQALYQTSAAARAFFHMAEGLRPGTLEQCFHGSKELLSQTLNTQPCLFCVDMAAALALKEAGIRPAALAGFSLGELAALTFGGSLSPEEGFDLVCQRAAFMEKAAQKYPGKMAAVLKLPAPAIEDICQSLGGAWPANYNQAQQTVVAMEADKMEEFSSRVKALGGRAIPLAVSGGFHAPFMDEAAAALEEVLADAPLKMPSIPVYANLTARPYGEEREKTLARQMNHAVRWEETIQNMHQEGIEIFIEVGPGKVLRNLIKKILPQALVLNVEDAQSLADTLNTLEQKQA